jgi:peptide/nickel transport system permease protein
VIALLLRRLAYGLLVVWLVVTAVFFMYFVAPRDVARTIAGRQASAETVAMIRHNLGLDDPIAVQYGHYLVRLAHGDLGESYLNGREPINAIIARDVPPTFSLVLGAAVLWTLVGVLGGVLAATKPRSLTDRIVTAMSLLFFSSPAFLVGSLLLLFLFYQLTMAGFRIFPASSYVPLTENPWQWARHLILPWTALALVSAGAYTRLTRGVMLDVLNEDFVRTARAKGLRDRRVVYRHALRAAAAPIVTQVGLDVGGLLGGAVVIEQVFALNGLGKDAVDSIMRGDLMVIMALSILACVAVVFANLVVDICYAVIDPRVRIR